MQTEVNIEGKSKIKNNYYLLAKKKTNGLKCSTLNSW